MSRAREARDARDEDGLGVVGAGFGRTGTTSLCAALNALGVRAYHMDDAKRRAGDLQSWARAASGEATVEDVAARVLRGYRATTDFPACLHYKELLRLNPRAKVVLTSRDAEEWYASASETIFAFERELGDTFVLRWLLRGLELALPFEAFARGRLMEAAWIVPAFGGSPRLSDRDHCIAVYNSHVEEVRRVVPPERLLCFDVKVDGWEKLCSFLEKPVPNTPFPVSKERAVFQRKFRAARWVDRGLLLGAAAAAAALGVVVATHVVRARR